MEASVLLTQVRELLAQCRRLMKVLRHELAVLEAEGRWPRVIDPAPLACALRAARAARWQRELDEGLI